jgi:hypothetical protein
MHPPPAPSRIGRLAPIFVTLAGCGSSATGDVRELPPLVFADSILSRDGGYSARFGDRSVWVFGDTPLRRAAADGHTWRSSTWSWTRDLDAADGIGDFQQVLDGNGAPGEFLPFTPDEAAFNAAHFNVDNCLSDCGHRFALWPGPVVVVGARALVFYVKIDARPGTWNFRSLGASIAVWDDPEKNPTRPSLRPDQPDPTLLFPDGEPGLAAAALVARSDSVDQLYAYACESADLTAHCKVARAPVDNALDRAAWRFYAGGAGWSTDFHDAVRIFDGAPQLTVHFSPHLGKYLAVYGVPLADDIAIRTADHPEGPWSDARVVGSGLPPSNTDVTWDYAMLAHPELAVDGGRREYLTYYRPLGGLDGEMRLVELSFP